MQNNQLGFLWLHYDTCAYFEMFVLLIRFKDKGNQLAQISFHYISSPGSVWLTWNFTFIHAWGREWKRKYSKTFLYPCNFCINRDMKGFNLIACNPKWQYLVRISTRVLSLRTIPTWSYTGQVIRNILQQVFCGQKYSSYTVAP